MELGIFDFRVVLLLILVRVILRTIKMAVTRLSSRVWVLVGWGRYAHRFTIKGYYVGQRVSLVGSGFWSVEDDMLIDSYRDQW